jgi:hypothetical protein
MFQEQPTKNDIELWHKVFDQETAYIQSRQYFLNNCPHRIGLIKKALHNPAERGTALRLIEYLEVEERQSLFDDLLDLASVSQSDIELCRKAILSLPKNWLLANIENSAEPLLQDGTDEEYRRLLELYLDIDRKLAKRLAQRAVEHDDPDIREVGEDFLSKDNNKRIRLEPKSELPSPEAILIPIGKGKFIKIRNLILRK